MSYLNQSLTNVRKTNTCALYGPSEEMPRVPNTAYSTQWRYTAQSQITVFSLYGFVR